MSNQPTTSNELENLRELMMMNEEEAKEEQNNNNQSQNQSQSLPYQQQEDDHNNEDNNNQEQEPIPPVPVDRLFFEACKKTGVDPFSAFNTPSMPMPPSHANTNNTKKGSSGINARNLRMSSSSASASQSNPSSPNNNNSRPSSAASSNARSGTNNNNQQPSEHDSVQNIATTHRFGAIQERKLRDLLTVLQQRKQLMQSKALQVSRKLKFKKKLQKKAGVLKSNAALDAAWKAELERNQAIRDKAASKNGENNNGNNNDEKAVSEIGSHYSVRDPLFDQVGDLGHGGEDVMFEQTLRQRQVWDLRTMRQQRAKDRRQAEYNLRLDIAKIRAEQEWKRHEKESDDAKKICEANHVLVKQRRARDEQHIADVEARFSAIDKKRQQDYDNHIKQIHGARSRRNQIMKHIIEAQTEHDRHLNDVNDNARRIELERKALIENNIENIEQQRTKHEFLRFIRDVELANRSLIERDHMLVVVNRAEQNLEAKREKIKAGFNKTEEAVQRVERETAERAKAMAENREVRHYEARSARIANDEYSAFRRLEKARREQDARERKAREDARRNAGITARFEQRRLEQEDRVDRLSRKMMAKREEILETTENRHRTVEDRQRTQKKIRTMPTMN